MSDQRWHRIEEICHEALERSPDERALFVREACATTKRCAWKSNRSSPTRVALTHSDPDSGFGIRDWG